MKITEAERWLKENGIEQSRITQYTDHSINELPLAELLIQFAQSQPSQDKVVDTRELILPIIKKLMKEFNEVMALKDEKDNATDYVCISVHYETVRQILTQFAQSCH